MNKDWEKRFDEARPDRFWMPKSALKTEQESPTKYFGYKWFDGKSVHEVTDWQNIKSFISNLLSAQRQEVIRRILDAKDGTYGDGQILEDLLADLRDGNI